MFARTSGSLREVGVKAASLLSVIGVRVRPDGQW